MPQQDIDKEKLYTNCDRCQDPIEITPGTDNGGIEYKNAYLCYRCACVARFDRENPIMYPIYKDER